MSEERRKILDMLAGGKIKPEEAERLLDAVEPPAGSPFGRTGSGETPKYLYIRVEPKAGSKSEDQVKVTVPLALVKAGMNFVSLLPKDARKEVTEAMESKGLDFDFNNLKGDEVEALLAALRELEVDVETADSTVKIYTG